MSFDLRIHFVGLNLFVPEEPSRMHVLLPSANHHKEHFARIIFDTAYLNTASKELTRTYSHVDIGGRVVDFTGIPVAEATINTHLPEEIPSIEPFVKPLSRSLVTSLPDPEKLKSRLSLGSGALSFYNLGARFFLDGDTPHRYSSRTEWTVRGITAMESAESGARAVLPARDLPGVDGSMARLPNLYPIGNTIHLLLFHAISEAFPPHGEDFRIPRPNQDKADHFDAFYGVSEAIRNTPTPTTAESADVVCMGAKVRKDGAQTPGHTCLGARASLEESAALRAENTLKARASEADDDAVHPGHIPIGHHVV